MDIINKYFADFNDTQYQQFEQLLPLYKEWNEKINVISRKDMDQFYLHHVLHSLSIATQFDFKAGTTVLDLGCGGGFPGIPLAIFFPEVEWVMVDSIRKKLTVVESIADAINLKNVTVKNARVEDIKDRKVEVVVSRAVAPLKDLWHWSKPLLKKYPKEENQPNGLICLKGGDLTTEIHESGCKPFVWEMQRIFQEPYFELKFMLYQPLK
jgi:16S rRNA (guanine527-N7)-methyltransferase